MSLSDLVYSTHKFNYECANKYPNALGNRYHKIKHSSMNQDYFAMMDGNMKCGYLFLIQVALNMAL